MRKTISVLAALIILAFSAPILFASDISNALFYGNIIVTNNSTAASEVSVNVSINTQALIDGGYLNATANNTVIRNSSGADVFFQPGWSGNDWMMWVPSIGANSDLTYILYTANSTGGEIRWFPGTGGVTTADNITLEFGNAFHIEWTGYVDTSAGSDKYLVEKAGVFQTYISGTANITSSVITYDETFPQVQAVNGGNDVVNQQNHTVNLPAGIVSDDLLIVVFGTDAAGVDAVITFPAGWTELDDTNGFSLVQQAIYYRIADGTEGATITVTTAALQMTAHTSYRIDNYSRVPEVGVAHLGNDLNPDPPNLAPSWGVQNTLWLVATSYDVGTFTVNAYPVNYINGRNDRSNNAQGVGVGTAERDLNAASENPAIYTLSAGTPHVEETIAIAPAFEEGFSVTADGIASGDMTVSTEIAPNNRPNEITGIPTTATVGVSYGGGILPVAILEEQELTSAAASITFSDIDDLVARWNAISGTTSRHLVVIINAASPDAVVYRDVNLRINGDSGANYNYQSFYGSAAVVGGGRTTASTSLSASAVPGTTYTDAYGGSVNLFPHAFNAINHKAMVSILASVEEIVILNSGRWANNNAITNLLYFPIVGNFEAGSTFQLGVIDERYLIEENILTVDGAITFAGIDGTGDDLVVIGYTRTARISAWDSIQHVINDDAVVANYWHELARRSGAVTTAASNNNNNLYITAGSTATANAFGGGVIFYPQYAEGANQQSYIGFGGVHSDAATSFTRIFSGRRANIAAITKLFYDGDLGNDFEAGSMMSLYRVPRTVIDRQELTAPQATITFSNIPQGYESLQVLIYARTDLAALNEGVLISYNNDVVAANYDYQFLRGVFAAASAARNAASREFMAVTAANEGANEFGGGIITINQYSKTDRHKHIIGLDGVNEIQVAIRSLRWEDLSPITEIDITTSGGNNFVAGSVFELVGVMPHSIFTIEVDGAIEAFDAAGTASVIDNTDNWEYAQNDVMPYVESITASGQVLYLDGTATSNIDAGVIHNSATELWVYLEFIPEAESIGVLKYLWDKQVIGIARMTLSMTSINTINFFKNNPVVNINTPVISFEPGQKYRVLFSISATNGVRLIFENGTPVTNADTTAVWNDGNVRIGSSNNPTNQGLIGSVVTVAIGTDDLTAAEESALFNDIIPSDANNKWYIDEGTGVNIIDYGTDGINGTAGGATSWQRSASVNRLSYQIALEGLITTTFTDRAASQQDGTATLRTSSSDPDVSATLAGFFPISEAKAPDYVLGQAPPFIEFTANITGNFTTVPPAGTFPLAPVIVAIANATNTPPQLPLLIIAAFIILAGSLTISATMRRYGSGSIFVKIIGIAMIMGIFVAIANFGIDFWMVVIFSIIGVALGMASKQLGWN